MKILHLLYSGLGGHGNVFFSMVNADVNQEFKYEAIFNGVEPMREEYLFRCNANKIPYNYVPKKQGLDLSYYIRIFKLIRKSTADILFLHGSHLILPAYMANLFSKNKKKILIRETQANHLKSRLDWLWLAVALSLADNLVFLHEEYGLEVSQKLKFLYFKKKVFIIPNGIDLTVFKPGKKSVAGNYTIGMQSRLVKIKDYPTLLKAFSLLKSGADFGNREIILKIAGEGDYEQELIEICKQLEIINYVQFTGLLEERELVEFLQSLDVYVHASFGETMSTAIMQAMACKLPIIASDVRGINNMIINDITGKLVPVQQSKKLADNIQFYFNNPEMAEMISKNAFDFAVNNYSNLTMFNRYRVIFLKK